MPLILTPDILQQRLRLRGQQGQMPMSLSPQLDYGQQDQQPFQAIPVQSQPQNRYTGFLGDALQGIGSALLSDDGNGPDLARGFGLTAQLGQQRQQQRREDDLFAAQQQQLAIQNRRADQDFQLRNQQFQNALQQQQSERDAQQSHNDSLKAFRQTLNPEQQRIFDANPEVYVQEQVKNQLETSNPLSAVGKLNNDFKKGLITEAEYNIALDQIKKGNSPSVIVNTANIDDAGNRAFSEQSGKDDAAIANSHLEDAQKANNLLGNIQQIETLLNNTNTGVLTPEINRGRSLLAQAGLLTQDELSQLDNAKAADAIINRIAPTLRVQGTGSQSEKELQNFLESLPSLRNTPGGNSLIIQGFKSVAARQLQLADLAAQVKSGEISRSEWRKRINSLPPLQLPSLSNRNNTPTQRPTEKIVDDPLGILN